MAFERGRSVKKKKRNCVECPASGWSHRERRRRDRLAGLADKIVWFALRPPPQRLLLHPLKAENLALLRQWLAIKCRLYRSMPVLLNMTGSGQLTKKFREYFETP
jgi:hypothetical protein